MVKTPQFHCRGTSSPLVRGLRSSHAHIVQDKYSKTDGWAGMCQILIKKSRWVAIATPWSAGLQGCAQKLTSDPTVPASWLPSLCHPPSCLLPLQVDYKGQKLAKQMFQGIFFVSAIVGFIYGYLAEQFGWTVYIVMAGFAFSCLLTLPPWPIYRRHPLKWLPVQDSSTEDKKPGERKVKRHAKNNWSGFSWFSFTVVPAFVLCDMS